jgi:hypothetical protein
MSKLTRGDLRTFAAQTVLRLTAAQLDSTDSTILNTFCNEEQDDWRSEFPGVQGFGERVSEETWNTDNTRHELPAEFFSLHPKANGRITLLDTSGDEDDQLEVITMGAYEQAWQDAYNRYTDRDDPVAYLWGVSTNDKRLIEIRPTPTTAIQFRVRYMAYLEVLDNDADELECPLGMGSGIKWGVASRFAIHKGSPKADDLRAEANRVRKRFESPQVDERHRPGIVLPFDHEVVGGYRAFEHAE